MSSMSCQAGLPKGAKASEKAILNAVEALFLSEKWSDMEIVCGDYTFPAHQAVVFPRSEYFAKACSGKFEARDEFLQPDMEQEPVGTARLASKNPFLVEKVLEFLYKGSYSPIGSNKAYAFKKGSQKTPADTVAQSAPAKRQKLNGASKKTTQGNPTPSPDSVESPKTKSDLTSNPAYFHARMYAEGDYFLIGELKDVAKDNFEHCMKCQFCPEFFLEVLHEVYSHHADYGDLKKAVTTAAIKNLTSLRSVTSPILDRDILASLPEFAEDLCMGFILKHSPKR